MGTNTRLFDDKMLRKLEQLTFTANPVRVGALKGDRQSRRRGTSIEFADYRNYVQGDDLRRLDWNVYARLEKPFVKITQDEEDLAVHILVDTSTSMDWPRPTGGMDDSASEDENKLFYALRLAGALGYIGLSGGDLVSVSLLDSQNRKTWGPFRNRVNGWPLIRFLEANYTVLQKDEAADAARMTQLDLFLRDYALRARRPGLLFLISDLFVSSATDPHAYRDGLRALQSRGYQPIIIHTLSPDEAGPTLQGDLKLVDIETGDFAEVSLEPETIRQYQNRLAEWTEEIRAFCRAREIGYIFTITNQPWDALILQTLRAEGVTD